jgi:hypothetical protein
LCLLAPALQLVPQRTELLVAPRFLSVPLLAVGLMVGQAARWLWLLGRSKVALRVLRVVVPSVLVVCAWLSFQRSRAWGDGRLFFAEELKRNATSTSVLFRAARRDANDGQKLSAWRRAACAYALALHRGDTRAAAALFMTSTQVAEEVAYDGPQGELSHLSEFLRDVVEGHAATFSLAGQELVYSASDVERGLLAAHRPTLLIMQARVLARLGSPQSVIAAQGAVESCRQCSFAVTTAARTFLQVGRTDAATRLLQSPVAASLSVEEKTRLTGFAARLASLESGGTGPTAVRVELERALMFSRHARVVELAERHPELFSKSESLLVEAVARSALRAGRPELAQEVLRRGFFASESEDVFVALEKEWGRGEPPVETYLPGRCVAPGEIQGDGF